MDMMTRYSFFLACVIMAGCAGEASRSKPVAHYFDCDVPPGHVSEWNESLLSHPARVSGTLQMIEARKDQKFLPLAKVELRGEDNSKAVGFEILLFNSGLSTPNGPPNDPDNAFLAVFSQDVDRVRSATFGKVPWAGRTINFDLRLSRNGELSITADGKTRTVPLLGLVPHKLALICSTGQFRFEHVVIEDF
jgi:hypothetical protein